jgi:predicted Zn-dependent protease
MIKYPPVLKRGARARTCTLLSSLMPLVLLAFGCTRAATDHLQNARQAIADAAYSQALDDADAGLGADPDPKTAWGLELVKLEAQARSGDAEGAKAQIEKLATAHPDRLPATQYGATADQLRTAGQAPSAIEVLDLGLKRHPDDASLAKLIAAATANTEVDPSELEKLRSLGYVQ